MKFEFTTDGFIPYESFDYIYKERVLPEFGTVKSDYIKEIPTWKFYLAHGEGEIPFGVEAISYDDSDWDLIDVPSTWQTEGYGLPQNLLYDYPLELEKIASRKEENVSDKFLLNSSSGANDDIGIYRTTVVFEPEDIDRALYLETSGICGSFDVFLNGRLICESSSVLSRKKLLLSEDAKVGVNLIVIVVYRWDRDAHGKIKKEIMNYGFSGIFRPIHIVSETLLELNDLSIKTQTAPAAYVNQLSDGEGAVHQLSDNGKIARVSRADYKIMLDFSIKNHTEYIMPYKVNVMVLEARGEYDPYKLPKVKLLQNDIITGTVSAGDKATEICEFVALDVAQWSDATPVQYDLIIELLDSENRVICAKKRRFGFRTTEIMSGKFNINERITNLYLTKYYEFDPFNGIAVPLDRIRQDIVLMKKCGLNGIILSSFPASDELFNICDQYGIYVVAIADKDNMADYMRSALVHPSIIMWGAQDYKFNANTFKKVKDDLSNIDNTRPWYCGIDYDMKISDIKPFPSEAGLVFGPWVDLCLDRKRIFEKNHLNHNIFETISGRSKEYDDDANYKWIHHADLVGDKQRANSCIGQGIVDSERNPHPIYLDIKKQCEVINIFSSPEDPLSLTMRNTHPFAYSPDVILEWKVMIGGNVVLSGRGSVSEIEPYGTRTLKFPANIAAFVDDGWADNKPELIEMYMNALSHELVFEVSLKLASNTYYSQEGYEIAFYQDVLASECGHPIGGGAKGKNKSINAFTVSGLLGSGVEESVQNDETSEDTQALNPISDEEMSLIIGEETSVEEALSVISQEYEVISEPNSVSCSGDDFTVVFDRNSGALSQINICGVDYLAGSMVPSFYRCPSNIDRTDRSFVLARTIFSGETDYEEIQESLNLVGINYSQNNGVFSFISRYKSFAFKDELLVHYEVNSSDNIKITLCFTPKYDLVRYGFRVKIIKDDLLCKWYGRGPGESYYDRKNATRKGLYAAGANKIYHPYARPSENSSHCDTKTMELTHSSGSSVRFTREKTTDNNSDLFEFTVLPYTPEQMNEFLHEEQLMQNEFCELFLDFCSREIERTLENISSLPLKKGVLYKESFIINLKK